MGRLLILSKQVATSNSPVHFHPRIFTHRFSLTHFHPPVFTYLFSPKKVGEKWNSYTVSTFSTHFDKNGWKMTFSPIWWVKLKFHPPKVGENSKCVFADGGLGGWFIVKIRRFCYLLKLREGLSYTVQNGIPQALCTDKIPCQTHLMVHDDIDITTRVSCEICTNKSADFRRFSANQNLYAGIKRSCRPREPGEFIARTRLITKFHT